MIGDHLMYIAFPFKITSRQQMEDVPHLGTKVLGLVSTDTLRFGFMANELLYAD